MKKNYLFLAAAATMFTACVQSDLVSEIPEAAPQAIDFDAFANKTTRGFRVIERGDIEKAPKLCFGAFSMARREGLEPPAFWFVAKHSIRLS